MTRLLPLVFVLIISAVLLPLPAQEHDPGNYPLALRGEVWIELEPIYGGYVDRNYPLDTNTARLRALEEAALFYSAMIYGWTFQYEIGERARQIPEHFELVPAGTISFGDPGLRATDAEFQDMRVRLWTDYHLTEAQQKRLAVWRTGTIRNVQGTGYGTPEEGSDWLGIRKAALEDAARAAVRGSLRGNERNRPKEAAGLICLASFPRFYISGGRWAVEARFRMQVNEIIPYAAY